MKHEMDFTRMRGHQPKGGADWSGSNLENVSMWDKYLWSHVSTLFY